MFTSVYTEIYFTIFGGEKMNEILACIKQRRSIRKFKPDLIPCEDMDAIIEELRDTASVCRL